eukprot:1325300-Pleurochrysis_carterae.AAC.1
MCLGFSPRPSAGEKPAEIARAPLPVEAWFDAVRRRLLPLKVPGPVALLARGVRIVAAGTRWRERFCRCALVVACFKTAGTHAERCAGCVDVERSRLAARVKQSSNVGCDVVGTVSGGGKIDLSCGLRGRSILLRAVSMPVLPAAMPARAPL